MMDDRSTWSWIKGRGELIDCLAERHHQALYGQKYGVPVSPSTPMYGMPEEAAIFGSRPDLEGPSWRELLNAMYRALEATGREIAAAKDQDSAAAAKVKYEAYEGRIDNVIDTLLTEAHRKLQRHPGTGDWLVGYGRRAPGSSLEIIKPADWVAGTPDWQRWRLNIDGQTAFYDIRLLDLQAADPAIFDAITADLAGEQAPEPKKTAAAETACREWLIEKLKVPRKCRKSDLRGEADQKFPGLSDKAFERAWSVARAEATTDPSWGRPGPPASS